MILHHQYDIQGQHSNKIAAEGFMVQNHLYGGGDRIWDQLLFPPPTQILCTVS